MTAPSFFLSYRERKWEVNAYFRHSITISSSSHSLFWHSNIRSFSDFASSVVHYYTRPHEDSGLPDRLMSGHQVTVTLICGPHRSMEAIHFLGSLITLPARHLIVPDLGRFLFSLSLTLLHSQITIHQTSSF